MAWTTRTTEYVKFFRMPEEAWETIVNPNSDTLYFVLNENSGTGKLYLGSKLITDGSLGGSSTLADLEDVLLDNNIPNNSLLVYDDTAHKWKPQSLSTIFSLMFSPMVGATAEEDGVSGAVPAPLAGDQNKYLRGDGQWADPTSSLSAVVTTLVGEDTGRSVRDIAHEEVATIVANAPASFDTLKEIADWIANHEDTTDVVAIANRLTNVENIVVGDGSTNIGLVDKVDNLQYSFDTLDATLRWLVLTRN